MPKDRADLAQHVIVRYTPQAPQPVDGLDWLFVERPGETPLRARIIVNSQMGIFETVRQNGGIGILPDYLAQAGDFVRILPDIAGPTLPLQFVYASEMRNSKRVGVLKTFIEAEINA